MTVKELLLLLSDLPLDATVVNLEGDVSVCQEDDKVLIM